LGLARPGPPGQSWVLLRSTLHFRTTILRLLWSDETCGDIYSILNQVRLGVEYLRMVGYRCLRPFQGPGRLRPVTARALQQGGTDSVMHRPGHSEATRTRDTTSSGQGSESMCTQQTHTAMRMSWFRTLSPQAGTLGPFSVAVGDLCKLQVRTQVPTILGALQLREFTQTVFCLVDSSGCNCI
jgi:hypothetical protein